jgi:hypothetical protein
MTWDEFHGLVARVKGGDRTCLPQLREVLKSKDYANWSRWFRNTFGSPAEWLKDSLGEMVGGKSNPAISEATEAMLHQLIKDLEGSDPTPIERLLAERAAFCWFTVNTYETSYNRSKDLTIRQAEFQVRKIDSAHKRFLSAVATLARVRKLALPALQVNIGASQVNVAS